MIRNQFTRGPEGWCSYDYHASMVAGKINVFVLTTWEASGGVEDGPHVWTNHTRWSADTPEKPLSILPLLHYRSWVDADPVDVRGAEMSVYLRGDGLILDGAACYFWVHARSTRWHLDSQPLTIEDGGWAAAPNRVSLKVDASRWHRSWSGGTENPLEATLAETVSYGFSFVGFESEVMGRLSMCGFAIER